MLLSFIRRRLENPCRTVGLRNCYGISWVSVESFNALPTRSGRAVLDTCSRIMSVLRTFPMSWTTIQRESLNFISALLRETLKNLWRVWRFEKQILNIFVIHSEQGENTMNEPSSKPKRFRLYEKYCMKCKRLFFGRKEENYCHRHRRKNVGEYYKTNSDQKTFRDI